MLGSNNIIKYHSCFEKKCKAVNCNQPKTGILATFQLACSRKEVKLGKVLNHYMDNEIQIPWDLAFMTQSVLVFKAYFNNYFMACYKQKSSLTYRDLKGFTCQKSMARQGGRVLRRTGTDPKASQNISTFIACLVLLLLLSLLLFSLFLFLNKYMHTQTPFICLLVNCLWLHWESLSIHYHRKNLVKAHLSRS